MESWEDKLGLGALESIRKVQEQFSNSFGRLSRQHQIMTSIIPNSGLLNVQEQMIKSLSGLNMMSEIAKSMKQYSQLPPLHSSARDAIAKSTSLHNSLAIPSNTLAAINSINQQHQLLFHRLIPAVEPLVITIPAISQLKNLDVALGRISGQLAGIAVKQKNWAILEDLDEVVEKAHDFTEELDNSSEQEQQRQFEILLSLVRTFYNKHKARGSLVLKVVGVFLMVANIHQYYDFLQTKPDLATKEDVKQITKSQDSISNFIRIINQELKELKKYRITNRNCKVRLKPKINTQILTELPVNFDVIVIQIHHKWLNVSYFDPKDNLPQTGWIRKKYLNKPK